MHFDHNYYMQEAFNEAIKAYQNDEVPIGSIIVNLNDGLILSREIAASIKNCIPVFIQEIKYEKLLSYPPRKVRIEKSVSIMIKYFQMI